MHGFIIATLAAAFVSTSQAANFSGTDSFDVVVPGNWTADQNFGVGAFTLGGGFLEYSTTGTPTSNDTSLRRWDQNYGSYTESWTLRIDVTLGNFTMQSNSFAGLVLIVENLADPTNDFARIVLRRDGVSARYFYSDGYANGTFLGANFIATGSTAAALQLSYSAASQTITAGYDADGAIGGYSFGTISTYNIASGSSDWGMTAGDQFRAVIYGQTVQTAISSGQMRFDNFVAVPEPSSGACVLLGLGLMASRHRAIRRQNTG